MLSSTIVALLLTSSVHALPKPGATILGFDEAVPVDQIQARELDAASLEKATILGFDNDTKEVHAFTRDHVYLGRGLADSIVPHLIRRQDVGNCGPWTTVQVSGIKGWGKLEDTRKGLFGDGEHQVHNNPQQEPDTTHNPPVQWNLPDLKAQRCIANDPIGELELVKDPVCEQQTTTIDGTSEGTNSTATISHTIGSTVSVSHSVSNQETVGITTSFQAEFGIPLIGKTTIKTDLSFEYSHTDQKATTEDKASTSTQTLSVANPSGKKCHASLNTETCHAEAKGEIKTYVSGWVWWSYKDKVQYNVDYAKSQNINFPDNNKHWSWTINVEGILSEDDRLLSTPLSSNIGTTQIDAMYDVKCE